MPEQVKDLPKIVDLEPYSRSFFFISEHFDLWTLASTPTSDPVPEALDLNSNIIGIYKNVTKVKRGDGSLFAWGNNAYGQLGIGQPNPLLFHPKPVKGIAHAELVAAGEDHTLAVTKDGKLYGWGSNRAHQIDTGAAAQYMTPRLIGTYTSVKKMQAGEDFSLLLLNNGQLYGWGNLQRIGLENAAAPTLIERFGQDKIADISAYERGAVILTANGDVYQMGGTLYAGTEVDPEDMIWKLDMGQAKAIAAGNLRSYAVLKDGTVWSWKNIVQKKKYAAAQLRDLRRWRRSRPEAGTETSRSD